MYAFDSDKILNAWSGRNITLGFYFFLYEKCFVWYNTVCKIGNEQTILV